MAGETGDPPSVSVNEMDAGDRASMEQINDKIQDAQDSRTTAAQEQQLTDARENVQERAGKKAELAQAMSASSQMRVDPAEVDNLAKFFEDEAQGLEDRGFDLEKIYSISAPGNDPVSTQAAQVYGQVGAGDDRAYFENYMKLAQVFRQTADSLRASAKQTRSDDQDAAESLK